MFINFVDIITKTGSSETVSLLSLISNINEAVSQLYEFVKWVTLNLSVLIHYSSVSGRTIIIDCFVYQVTKQLSAYLVLGILVNSKSHHVFLVKRVEAVDIYL